MRAGVQAANAHGSEAETVPLENEAWWRIYENAAFVRSYLDIHIAGQGLAPQDFAFHVLRRCAKALKATVCTHLHVCQLPSLGCALTCMCAWFPRLISMWAMWPCESCEQFLCVHVRVDWVNTGGDLIIYTLRRAYVEEARYIDLK